MLCVHCWSSWWSRLIAFCKLKKTDFDSVLDWLYIFMDSPYLTGKPYYCERSKGSLHLNLNIEIPSEWINLGLSLCYTCHTLLMLQCDSINVSECRKISLYDFTNHKLTNCGQRLHSDFNIGLQWRERSSIDKSLWNNFVMCHVTFTEKEWL